MSVPSAELRAVRVVSTDGFCFVFCRRWQIAFLTSSKSTSLTVLDVRRFGHGLQTPQGA